MAFSQLVSELGPPPEKLKSKAFRFWAPPLANSWTRACYWSMMSSLLQLVGLRPRVYYTVINFFGGGQGLLAPPLNTPMCRGGELSGKGSVGRGFVGDGGGGRTKKNVVGAMQFIYYINRLTTTKVELIWAV